MSEAKSDAAATVFVIVLSSFLAPFMASAMNVALPAIGAELSMDALDLGWVVTAYMLAAAVFLVPFGRAGDIYGRKRTFLLGAVVYALGSLVSAAAPSGAVLIAGRVINGAGAAMGFATGMAILMSVVPPQQRGTALGWNVAAVYLGLSLGPVLGGVIAHDLGWRWIFGISTVAGTVVIAFALRRMKGEWAEARGERFDFPGAVVYGVALVSLMYGCTLLPRGSGALLLAASALAGAGFVWWELRCRSPLFDVRIFRGNPVFALSNAAALINYAATAAVGFLLSLYLQYTKGLTPRGAGMVLIAQPIVMTLFSPVAGRLSDRIQPRKLAALGMAFNAAGLALFSLLRPETDLRLIAANLCLLGFGFALFSSPNTNAVMSSVERKYYGVASGTLSSMRLIGQMMSMAVVMLLIALFVGHVQIVPANYPQFEGCVRMAFGVFAGLCTLGVLAAAVPGKSTAPAGAGRR